MAYLTDGYQTLVGFDAAPAIQFKEKEVQPPDLDGGGEVDTTTMHNVRWRTKQPKHLVSAGDMSIQAQYDPILYSTIVSDLLNVNNLITITFPDGATLEIWGWVDKFTPAPLKEGEFPLAEVKIHFSNQDDNGVEQAPVYTAP